jgi:signal transduction histidine kinase
LADIASLVAQAEEAGITVETSVEGQSSALPASVDLAAYRIVQESLTNVVKHASGSRARVEVRFADDTLSVEVTNDMPRKADKAAAAAESGGLGLVGMRERTSLLGGSLEAGPTQSGGFRVRAVLPKRVPV